MASTSSEYRVGRGIADITGEAAECGMLGYGVHKQVSTGLHNRLRARAFVFAAADARLLLVVCEVPLLLESLHREVLHRLEAAYGSQYTFENVMLTATHTHCGPGGYADRWPYNSNTHGFRPQTFGAIADGILEAVARAHADLAPADLGVATGQLHDASTNRSPSSFARNPAEDRAHFPDAIDPQTTLLRIERDGRLVGAVNWFATHGTSMTNRNTLISSDNKGYAAYRWERLDARVDYLAEDPPDFVAAFAQTNAGDMSPNLGGRRIGSGPTEDEFENTRIIGGRQAAAAAKLVTDPATVVTGGLDARATYVDLSDFPVQPEFTGDGQRHHTGPALVGAAALAGTDEGLGPLHPLVKQGRNRIIDALVRNVTYRLSPRLRDAHAPKGAVVGGSRLNKVLPFIAERAPVQLLRIGHLYLIGIPAEVTIVAGLRLRRTVAAIVGAELADVLVAGYSNGYLHYVTTPEEYDEQRYEGGSTMFGRWELPALQQVVAGLATAMREQQPVPAGPAPVDLSGRRRSRWRGPAPDIPVDGHRFGDVIEAPHPGYPPGATVRAVFAGAHPNNDLRRGDSYLRVQRDTGAGWVTVADDGDWSTIFRWRRSGRQSSVITVTWDVPAGTAPGRYRLRYDGTARGTDGRPATFTGTTEPFEITAR
ncbi:MAG TPA: neutral/alkaline non-lysosomal ceramidase N-terminal domain-containing protein [Mycobacterium sp.]|nr:neutral/alkaline non-lysosomal ceramidase N-terminal domain-containing protein [Mycobacterium sp.]